MKNNHCDHCVEEAIKLDIFGALFQTIFKMTFATMTGSVALGASGLFSLADFFTKMFSLVSVKVGKLPPSTNFPYGYGKIQFLSSIFISMALIIGAIFILVGNFHAAGEFIAGGPAALALFAVVLSASMSEIMYRYLSCAAGEHKLANLHAAAWDNRADALSGIAVFIGVLLSNLGWDSADYWAGALISVVVIYIGVKIFYDSFKSLLDVSIPEEVRRAVIRLARRTPGVMEVEFCRGRSLGETWELSMQVEVDKQLSSTQIHEMIETLREKISEMHPEFSFIQISNRPVEKQDDPEDTELINAFKEQYQ
ncbi:MAG: cation transporter [SAR324 cluster bacterium]|nr:cation transporter [SAR324 cluster bacterium]